MGWNFEHYCSWDAVLAPSFQERWARWGAEARNGHVFLQAPVARAWMETYRPIRDISPRVVVARKGDCAVLLPLVLWKKSWKHAGCRVLTIVGSSDFDYLDPLVVSKSPDFDWQEFWTSGLGCIAERYGAEFDVLELGPIRSEAVGNDAGFREQDICPYLNLQAFKAPSDFWDWMASGQRSELRRRSKKLDAQGSIEFHSYGAGDLADAERSLREMLIHHRLRWPGAYKAPNFHLNLLRALLATKHLHFSDLRVGGVPISWRMGFTHNRRFYSYMPAFKQEFASFSPGIIHLVKVIELCITDGFTIYDYLRGGESYKQEWTTDLGRVHSLKVSSRNPLSRLRIQSERVLSACALKFLRNPGAG